MKKNKRKENQPPKDFQQTDGGGGPINKLLHKSYEEKFRNEDPRRSEGDVKKRQLRAKDQLKERSNGAKHEVRCCLMPGKLPKRRSSKELYVVGRFAEDRAIWNEELQRHCGEDGKRRGGDD